MQTKPGPILLVLLQVLPALAFADPQLGLPLRCTVGTDCWIANYVDTDPSPKAADFTCGRQTYNRHKGTDFALRDRAVMQSGVDVIAAADGTVLRVRDGMPDETVLTEERRKELKRNNRDCGNGIVIDHGDGWETQYCHLREDSVVVKPGDVVRAGDKLGLVGQSGRAEFPHVHLSVTRNGKQLDPFTGADKDAGCGRPQERLWRDPKVPVYEPFSIYALGFAGNKPDVHALRIDASSPDSLLPDVPVLSFWALMYGLRQGDTVIMEIRDPADGIFSQRRIDQERTRARQYYYVGKRARGLQPGTYTGIIRVVRKQEGRPSIEREKTVTVLVKQGD